MRLFSLVDSCIRSFWNVAAGNVPRFRVTSDANDCALCSALVLWAGIADLIYVFLDPIGQSLCTRCMRVVEAMQVEHGAKMRFCLTKADQLMRARDHDRVLVQITQNLATHIRDKNFSLECIYVPSEAPPDIRLDNGIENVCSEISTVVDSRVQSALVALQRDTEQIIAVAESRLSTHEENQRANRLAGFRSLLVSLALVPLPLALVLILCFSLFGFDCSTLLGERWSAPLCWAWSLMDRLGHERLGITVAVLLSVIIFAIVAAQRLGRHLAVLPRSEVNRLTAFLRHAANTIIPQHDELFAAYLAQTGDPGSSARGPSVPSSLGGMNVVATAGSAQGGMADRNLGLQAATPSPGAAGLAKRK